MKKFQNFTARFLSCCWVLHPCKKALILFTREFSFLFRQCKKVQGKEWSARFFPKWKYTWRQHLMLQSLVQDSEAISPLDLTRVHLVYKYFFHFHEIHLHANSSIISVCSLVTLWSNCILIPYLKLLLSIVFISICFSNPGFWATYSYYLKCIPINL